MRAREAALVSAKAVAPAISPETSAKSIGADVMEFSDAPVAPDTPPPQTGETAFARGFAVLGTANVANALAGGAVSILDGAGTTKPLGNERDPYGQTIVGTNGRDVIDGTIGADKIYGNGGDDLIRAGDGNDLVNGGEGRDFIDGGRGHDQILGGLGADYVRGGEGNDYVNGGTGADALYGDAGNDQLFGLHDDDYLYGGAGDDQLNGELGNDSLYGEDGKDMLSGWDGNDYLLGGGEADELNGGAGEDVMEGGEGDDKMFGENDNDRMWGGTGNDTMFGGNGADALRGEAGIDRLLGDAGDDYLDGGADADFLRGGDGRDIFAFTEFGGVSAYNGVVAFDTVRDFQFVTNANQSFSGDTIYLSRLFDQYTNFAGNTAKQAFDQGYLKLTDGYSPEGFTGMYIRIDRNGAAADVPGQESFLVAFVDGVSTGDFAAVDQPFALLDKYFLV